MSALEQMSFDIDSLIEEANPRPAYTGRRVGFHHGPITIPEVDAIEAEARHRYGSFGIAVGFPHIWLIQRTSYNDATPDHQMAVYWADLRCDYERDTHAPGRCLCVGDLVCRSICECGWSSHVTTGNEAIEAWHDHAWPGWRNLPVVPTAIRPRSGGITKTNSMERKAAHKALAWVTEHYPTDWQKLGAPVITERNSDIATGHVSGYSPSGGYDLSNTATPPQQERHHTVHHHHPTALAASVGSPS